MVLAMIKVLRFGFDDGEHFEQARYIRGKVFIEEEGVDPALEYKNDENAHHYLLMLGNKAIGAARWRETGKGIKLERFAMLKEYRNRGLGEIILKEVLKDVIPEGKLIYLHSQSRAVPFYERNGFVKAGNAFVEAGIEHFYMEFRS